MKKVVLAGGTGNLGKLLTSAFVKNGWHVIILSRNANKQNTAQISWEQWDGEHIGKWTSCLEGADAVINLSGKSIQCRFTEQNKRELYNSRILPTKVIAEAIQGLLDKPKIWINFSGVSLFNELATLQDENSLEIGTGFLAELSRDWENAFLERDIENVHQVIVRISPVLLADSGFFTELLPLVKMGLGGKVGNGKQWMNWIHYQDLVNLILWILEEESPSKVYHACSPNPSTNASFMKIFRKIVGMPLGFPLPTLLAKVGALVKGVDPSLLLDSTPVTTTATIQEGFIFHYPNAEIALQQLLNKSTK